MVFMMDTRTASSRGPSPLRPPVTPFKVDTAVQPFEGELHPVFHPGRVAVITGAASGIGRAAAEELAKCVSVLHSSSYLFFIFVSWRRRRRRSFHVGCWVLVLMLVV